MCVILRYCISNPLVRVRILFLSYRKTLSRFRVTSFFPNKTKNTRETAPIQRRSPGVKIFYLDYNLNTFHLLIKAVFVISAATYLFDVCFLVINVSDYADRCAVIAIGYFYSCPFGACMHHLAVADVHGYMVNAASVSIEEEVSGLCI